MYVSREKKNDDDDDDDIKSDLYPLVFFAIEKAQNPRMFVLT